MCLKFLKKKQNLGSLANGAICANKLLKFLKKEQSRAEINGQTFVYSFVKENSERSVATVVLLSVSQIKLI